MSQHPAKMRNAARRRNKNKQIDYGAKLFFEVKKYDGDGNLIETVSPDDLMARPIGATRKYNTMYKRRIRGASLHKTNGEGPMKDYNKVATKIKRGAKLLLKGKGEKSNDNGYRS